MQTAQNSNKQHFYDVCINLSAPQYRAKESSKMPDFAPGRNICLLLEYHPIAHFLLKFITLDDCAIAFHLHVAGMKHK